MRRPSDKMGELRTALVLAVGVAIGWFASAVVAATYLAK